MRAMLSVSMVRITHTGEYDNQRIIIGELYDNTNTPFMIVLNKSEPYIYVGEIKKYPFNIFYYDNPSYPSVNFDGAIKRYEEVLPNYFKMKNNFREILDIKPTHDFSKSIRNHWKSTTMSYNDIKNKKFKGLWCWTYEIDLNSVSGISRLYVKSKKDL